MNITDYIPYGRENAITRLELANTLHFTDRKIREAIEEARREGEIIINLQDGKGYYRTSNLDEIEKQYWQRKNRAMSLLVQQKHLRQKLKAAGRAV